MLDIVGDQNLSNIGRNRRVEIAILVVQDVVDNAVTVDINCRSLQAIIQVLVDVSESRCRHRERNRNVHILRRRRSDGGRC